MISNFYKENNEGYTFLKNIDQVLIRYNSV